MKNKWFNLLDLYLLIISIIWLVGWLIWGGTALYAYVNNKLISNEEYLARNYYQIDACETDGKYVAPETQPIQKTPEEIKTCKETAQKKSIDERNYQLKQDLLGWMVWGWLFILMFLIHFPFFVVRLTKKNTDDEVIKDVEVSIQTKDADQKNKKK